MPRAASFPPNWARQSLLLAGLLAANLALALETNQIRVLRSNGTPVTAADGVSAAAYLGGNFRSYGVFIGDGIFQFPSSPSFDNARITRHYLTSPPLPPAAEVSLVDFHVDVLASPFAGGASVNVNHGLALYQGNNHKAYFPSPTTAGQYHIDVVPGQGVRALVTKDYLSAFTAAADPALDDSADVTLQLVDFRADVLASPFAGGASVNVNHGLALYQGNSHKAYFPTPTTAGQYHIDVVPGQGVRALVTKDYLSAFTAAADPALDDSADVTLQLVDFRADVLASPFAGGASVNVNHGLALYQGNSHKAYFPTPTTAGQYHIDVVPGQGVRALVTKDYLSAFTAAADPALDDSADVTLQLVDFRADVLASPFAGGAPINVNHGLALYLNTSHKAYFPAPAIAGRYHIDVVPGQIVRALVTKDYMSAFTDSVDPAAGTGADATLQLVDFAVGLNTVDCAPVALMSAAVYLGSSHKAYFSFTNPASQLHHDVVPGVAPRALLTQNYQSVFSAEMDAANDLPVDVWHQVPRLRFTFHQRSETSGFQLFRGSSYMCSAVATAPGVFELPLLDGLTDLWALLGNVPTPHFTVDHGLETLMETDGVTITLSAGSCQPVDPGVVAVSVTDTAVRMPGGGQVVISWSTTEESNLRGFRIQRDDITLDTLLAASGMPTGAAYQFVDVPGASGDFHYTLLRVGIDGGEAALADFDAHLEDLPEGFALAPPVPNPFNPTTRLDFQTATAGRVRLAVYNLAGQQVALLLDEDVQPGGHQAVFEARGLASGLYVAVLDYPGGRLTQKMTLLR